MSEYTHGCAGFSPASPPHPTKIDLVDALQEDEANEQAGADGEANGKAGQSPESAPAPSPSPPPSEATSSTANNVFFAPPRSKKIKTGSFRLTVDVLPHPVFSRGDDGADLYTSVAISLEEALTGFTREIVALDGSTVGIR